MWKLIDDTVKDGRFVTLLILPELGPFNWNPLEDDHISISIGFNSLKDTGEDAWHFVGWDWQQDCFEDGKGTPVYYQEMPEITENLRNMFRPPQERTIDPHDWTSIDSINNVVNKLPIFYIKREINSVIITRGGLHSRKRYFSTCEFPMVWPD